MMKYEYGFEDWSRSTDRYTIECDRKLDEDEILFLINEVEATLSDKSGTVVESALNMIISGSDYEITRGKENLK